MAQEFVTLVGGVDPDTILKMGPREQLLLVEGAEPVRCRQTQYYEVAGFRAFRKKKVEVRGRMI